jgi:ribonuclease-3
MEDTLRERIGYAFRNPDLLRAALTHRSYGASHNERLEFVGDAVLDCVVGVALYTRFPAFAEGDLSRIRAALVNQETLARVARGIALGGEILLGEGEHRSGGGGRASILADAMEALFGAVFIDGGYEAAREVIEKCYGDVLARADPAVLGKDPKTRLQEWLQGRRMPVPAYAVVDASGEAHAQVFSVECRIPALDLVATGSGGTRRAAEQAAAEQALAMIEATGGRGG